MLGDTGNSHWKMPCIDLHGMSLVVVVFLGEELILYAEISWSCWIACGNTVVLVEWIICGNTVVHSWIRAGMKIEVLSLDLLSPLLWK